MLGLLTRPERWHLSQTNNLCQHIYKDGISVRKGSFFQQISGDPASSFMRFCRVRGPSLENNDKSKSHESQARLPDVCRLP